MILQYFLLILRDLKRAETRCSRGIYRSFSIPVLHESSVEVPWKYSFLVTEMETLQKHLFDVADKKHGWCPWRALKFRIHPSQRAAQLLSVLKAGFLLYRSYHLHNNTPCVYTTITAMYSNQSTAFPSVWCLSLRRACWQRQNDGNKWRWFQFPSVTGHQSLEIFSFPLLRDWFQTGTIWYLVSVSGRVKGLQSSSPFPLTSILAPLIPPVCVYKCYTFRQPPWSLKSQLLGG